MTSHLLALLLSLIAVILPPRYGCVGIIGGRVVRPHSWPFMAAIQTKDGTVCGGALVEKQWVLTAAHCQLNKSEVRVVLGAHQASIAEKEQQIFKVMHNFPNPQFRKSSWENDIMLLKLNGTAKLNKYVGCLPLPDCFEDIKPGTTCKVAGWGDTSSSRKPSKYLQEATLKIVDRKSCSPSTVELFDSIHELIEGKPVISATQIITVVVKSLGMATLCRDDAVQRSFSQSQAMTLTLRGTGLCHVGSVAQT
ncbi:granzyme A-like [Phoenicopterus ruber ruber]